MAESRRTCASCGTTNEEDARFCEGCGGSLARTCATCGVEASATARFCRGCGAPLGITSAPDASDAGPVRKTVTVMFADLAGSTSFEERVDAETAREVIGSYHDLLKLVAKRHRAGVTKYIGDGFMAVWGVPEIGPEDAARAIDAAVELQERFVDLAARVADVHGVELALRVAVNTGEVVVGAGDADLVGDALNVCARLESECPRGHVVVGGETWRATRGRYRYESLGEVQVKGRTAPVSVYQWVARQSESSDAAPFVGRGDEIRRLQATMDDAVSARTARLVTVIGDPGVGKSRLAAEFAKAQSDARVVEARCVLDATVALGPLVEVIRATDLESGLPADVPDRDRLLRDLDGLAGGVPGSVEENFWALRRFVEVLAASAPVVLVLDDIQWADTLLLDFIEHLVEWVNDVPVLVLALARPELRDVRPELATVSRWASEAVHLGGLDAGATAELAARVLGASRLPADLLTRLPSSTGGNPLFVRELIGMLAHDGVLLEEPHGWRLTIDVDAIAIPPTIHALLASRLERLEAADRRVLEIASVIGSDFSVGTVRALTDRGAEGIKLSLKRLRRLELAQPSGAYVGDEPVWRFHHVLIRDVAYRRLLKSDRAELHERLANWIAAGGQSVAFDADEMIARHLEAAHRYRTELGTVDEHTRDLAVRSARHYAASARRALDRDELVSAGTQAARGARVAIGDNALHSDLLLIGCEAYLSAGDVAAGSPLVDELERIADDALAPWATCYRCQFIVYTEPERLPEVDARLQGAIDEFGRRKDPAGLAKAHRVRASARSRLGRIGDCESDLFEALIAARQSGDHRQITAALGAAPGAALWGPSPVPKAGGRCLDVVRMQRMTTAAPSLEATSLRHLAVLEMLRGRPDKARTMLADARQVVADLGLRHGLMETELFAGLIESMEGDAVAAEPHFRTALDGFKALGVGADAGQAAALLARMILAQGRVDEADRYASESERLAGRNLKAAIAWRAVRAEILSWQGRHQEAVALAREAVSVASGTDLVLDHADACLALRRVLESAGDTAGANATRASAEALYGAKEVAARLGRVTTAKSAPGAEAAAVSSRMTVSNRAAEVGHAIYQAMREGDVDTVMSLYAERIEYDDRRRWSGAAIDDVSVLRVGFERILQQFSHFDETALAVRGDRLVLGSARRSDDSGNEATDLVLIEIDDAGRIVYEGRFDEDFESAYRELERRYYAGEGAAFAEMGGVSTESIAALNAGDFDRLLGELSTADLRIENRTRSAFPDRSADDLRASFGVLNSMVSSSQSWLSVVRWLSPRWSVSRLDREAVGEDDERYTWTRLLVIDICDGRIASICQFEPDEEDTAFAYAEEQVRDTSAQLAIANRASATSEALGRALNAADVDGAMAVFSDALEYDDRRQLSGNPVADVSVYRAAVARLVTQYDRLDWHIVAVRGDRLTLMSTRLSSDAGFEATYLHVFEVNDDGLIVYEGRFDEEDFEDAYREFENRYYTGEGMAFASNGRIASGFVDALDSLDVEAARRLSRPDCRWIVPASMLTVGVRTVDDFVAWMGERAKQVSSLKNWLSLVRWFSPTCVLARSDVQGFGPQGEKFTWSRLNVAEFRDGLVASVRQFDVDDEAAAIAYAEERVRETTSRLPLTNLASRTVEAGYRGLNTGDVDTTVANYAADQFIFDDRRRLIGNPIGDVAEFKASIARLLEQYDHFDWRTLAIRGERLALVSSRGFNDAGFETSHLHVCEVNDAGLVTYHSNFDEDDFDAATLELDRRYFAGEGAAFAENGIPSSEAARAMNRSDFDLLFGELCSPELVIESRSSRAFPHRSADDLRRGFEELDTMVASKRTWNSAMSWLSATCSVIRLEREAVGHDGEKYQWAMLLVAEHAHGRLTTLCEFDADDEHAAFAYADGLVQMTTSRLAVTNPSCDFLPTYFSALRTQDVEPALALYADEFNYDDHRRLSGDPVMGREAMRVGIARMFDQYHHYNYRVLAVRGERLHLLCNDASDDDGNLTTSLQVFEVDSDSRIVYHGRFDEDDFDGAYRELDRRYFAGEGAAFGDAGDLGTEWVIAVNRGDFEKAFGELTAPGSHMENRSRSPFPDPSVSDLGSSYGDLNAMVASTRTWFSVIRRLSSTDLAMARFEREALGHDGEKYSWTWIVVGEVRNGKFGSSCMFDLEDEEAAFAYAEELTRASASRLGVTNLSVASAARLGAALNAGDLDEIMECFSDRLVYEDRRRLTGDPINGRAEFRVAFERILAQYSHFERRILAVRGDRLNLHWGRWTDDSGNETAYLHVYEMDDDGRQIYEGRFDEDNFEGAYGELERRYYSGEGAEFAAAGSVVSEYILAVNRGDLTRVFHELTASDAVIDDRTRRGFGVRSAAETLASVEELNRFVTKAQSWSSAVCWLSRTLLVARSEREAVGPDDQSFAWAWLAVIEICDGRYQSMCVFEIEDEDAAFAYAEERLRAVTSRLAVENRCRKVVGGVVAALLGRDIDATLAYYSDEFRYGDHRRLTGDPVSGLAQLRYAFERILQQYSSSEWRTLAVRGDNLSLSWSTWGDESGNQTSYLHVFELGDDGLIVYEGRFDEEDFEGAYRDLEERYYAGEGAAFAEAGATATEFIIAYNQDDFDRLFGTLTAPDTQFENRSRSVFPDRALAEYRTSVEELSSMVSSARTWYPAMSWISPTLVVARFDREAVGEDGERYAWTRIYVSQMIDGRLTLSCQFEIDDEDQAFAYAEERARTTQRRLAVTNRASERGQLATQAAQERDVEAMIDCYVEGFVYDDRRRLSGNPLGDRRSAAEGILAQYTQFDGRTLAVRGERLSLSWSRWRNDEGFETNYLIVHEVDDTGRFIHEGRFDEDDFENAYRELEERYYSGEEADLRPAATAMLGFTLAVNRFDLDRAFSEFTDPGFNSESRSQSIFAYRTAGDFRASIEELHSMVAEVRVWYSATSWPSPTVNVSRYDREALGHDGEQYTWSGLNVAEIHGGRITSMCQFDVDDEAAAFAYAEERIRQSGDS